MGILPGVGVSEVLYGFGHRGRVEGMEMVVIRTRPSRSHSTGRVVMVRQGKAGSEVVADQSGDTVDFAAETSSIEFVAW